MDTEPPGTPGPPPDFETTLPDDLRDPAFAGPDVVFGSHRQSVIWPVITVFFGVAAIFFVPIILGPIAIICGLIAISRSERFARTALAFAVVCMLTGLIFGALVLHHHHPSLIEKVTFL